MTPCQGDDNHRDTCSRQFVHALGHLYSAAPCRLDETHVLAMALLTIHLPLVLLIECIVWIKIHSSVDVTQRVKCPL